MKGFLGAKLKLMDFLDPRKRRHHNIKLMIGYSLTAIAIGLTSVILVYGANGYGINTKTGDIIQHGLLFVDSKPGGASIYLNNKIQSNTTSARLVLPAGSYDLTIKKTGYRDWNRKFTLTEQSISRFVYPFLFPVILNPQNLKIYGSLPPLATQSPDKHWLLIQSSPADSKALTFDMYDLTKIDQAPAVISLQASLLSGDGLHSLKAIEWTGNSNQLLLKHSFSGGSEFIVLNRTDPAQSFNVNRTFGVNPSQVSLHNKKTDQLYVYDQTNKSLALGDVARSSLQPLLKDVLAYKSYGSDLLSYVTDQKVAAGQVMARIWENGKTYPLYTFASGSIYLLDAAQFQGHWYYVAGSDKANRINIYKDPLSGIKDPQTARAIPLIALPNSGANNLTFSDKNRFIGVETGQKFAVYDIEVQSRYQYDLAAPLNAQMHWMDDYRYIGLSNGSIFVMDYDGVNQQRLDTTTDPNDIFFSKDYNQMFALAAVDSGVALQRTDLRAGGDLPK